MHITLCKISFKHIDNVDYENVYNLESTIIISDS